MEIRTERQIGITEEITKFAKHKTERHKPANLKDRGQMNHFEIFFESFFGSAVLIFILSAAASLGFDFIDIITSAFIFTIDRFIIITSMNKAGFIRYENEMEYYNKSIK